MRFHSAREAGLSEDRVERIDQGYAAQLGEAECAPLELTDAIIGMPQRLDAGAKARLARHYDDAQIVELALGVGLFLGMSKALIVLGLEPGNMPTTVIATPGS